MFVVQNPDELSARICPFLGLPDDPASHFSFADLAHRCHAKEKARPIDLNFQAEACLGGKFEHCRRFQTAERPIPAWHPAAHLSFKKGNAVTSTARRPRRWLALVSTFAFGAALVAIVLLVASALLQPPGGEGDRTQAAQLPSVTALTTATPTLSPTAGPATTGPVTTPPTPSATATPTNRPTNTPTPRPTRTPTPTPIIHLVQRGETLRYIASLYGVTVNAIVEANEIENRSRIFAGQELIIPTE